MRGGNGRRSTATAAGCIAVALLASACGQPPTVSRPAAPTAVATAIVPVRSPPPTPTPAPEPERILMTVSSEEASPGDRAPLSALADGSDTREGGPRVPAAQVSSLTGRIVYSKRTTAQPHSDVCGSTVCVGGWTFGAAIATANADATAETLLTSGGYDTAPTFSPDGQWIAFQRHATDSGGRVFDTVAIMDADGRGLTAVPPPQPGASYVSPVWSPDGAMLGVERITNGQGAVVLLSFQGLVPVRTLVTGDFVPSAWSRDGGMLAAVHNGQVWVVPSNGGPPRQVTWLPAPAMPKTDFCGQLAGWAPLVKDVEWSPDDALIAFAANDRHVREVNLTDVYVVRTDGSGLRLVRAAADPVCVRGGLSPLRPLDVVGWSGGMATGA